MCSVHTRTALLAHYLKTICLLKLSMSCPWFGSEGRRIRCTRSMFLLKCWVWGISGQLGSVNHSEHECKPKNQAAFFFSFCSRVFMRLLEQTVEFMHVPHSIKII